MAIFGINSLDFWVYPQWHVLGKNDSRGILQKGISTHLNQRNECLLSFFLSFYSMSDDNQYVPGNSAKK